MERIVSESFGLLALIVGVATLAVLVSRNANTAGVLKAGGDAFSAMVGAATAPVSGGTFAAPFRQTMNGF